MLHSSITEQRGSSQVLSTTLQCHHRLISSHRRRQQLTEYGVIRMAALAMTHWQKESENKVNEKKHGRKK